MDPHKPVIECVPNISEGTRPDVLEAIARAIRSVDDVILLHQDRSPGANRTVFTFAGPPEAVIEAAVKMYGVALESISMTQQHGAHPRIGVVDVCPLVPLRNITLEQTAEWAAQLAQKVASLGVPVYFYETNARWSHRTSLPQIRKGQYEGLRDKLADPQWRPDCGPEQWSPAIAKSGATILGARNILIAFNVTLQGGSPELAHHIAASIRQNSKIDAGANALPYVRAIGWYMEDYHKQQVSCNLLQFSTTGLYDVFERIEQLAHAGGAQVVGAEIIGCSPLKALTRAGEQILKSQKQPWTWPDRHLAQVALERMQLQAHKPFDLDERILEYALPPLRRPMVLLPSDSQAIMELVANPYPVGFNLSLMAAILSAYRIIIAANHAAMDTSPAAIWHEFSLLSEQAEGVLEHLRNVLEPLIEDEKRTQEGLPLLSHHAEEIMGYCLNLQQIGLNVIKFGPKMPALEAFSAVHRLKGLIEEIPYRIWMEPEDANPSGYKSPRRRFQIQIKRTHELQNMARKAMEAKLSL
jgi:glutamate formiminotransferase/formiminotetrahydrofolate cyclodeaminase